MAGIIAASLRLAAPLALVLLAHPFAFAQPQAAPPPHPTLADVVKEYKRLGLPLLPPNAQLVRVDSARYVYLGWDDPGAESYNLVFRIPPTKPGERLRYLAVGFRGVGLQELEYVDPAMVKEVKPTPDVLYRLESEYRGYWLTLAVQCQTRGWTALAAELYSRAIEGFPGEEAFRSVSGELHGIAWIYWGLPLTTRGGDRKEALRRLTALAEEDQEFRRPSDERLLRSLKLTVAPSKAKPGSVESLIDELTEYQADQLNGFRAVDPASYWKLAELGFDAVPALIEHVRDDRLTRAWAMGFHFSASYQVTVGHLCSRLLYDLSGRTIGGDYWELRGDRLDPDEARKWFEKAKKVGEEKWLVDHAIPADGGEVIVNEAGRPEPQIARAIGAKHPARLPAIYRAMLKKPVVSNNSVFRDGVWANDGEVWANDFVNEIVASKLPQKEKIALLEEGAAHESLDHRVLALGGLAKLDHAAFRKHLLATLKQIETRPRAWSAGTGWTGSILRMVESAGDRASWDALAAAARAVGVETRMGCILSALPFGPPSQNDPHRLERIRFLVQFLDDRSEDDEVNGTSTEVRDFAASRLAALLGFRVRRMPEPFYVPVCDGELGPVARLVLREFVRQAAAQELGGK